MATFRATFVAGYRDYGRAGETSKSQKCKSARTKCKSRLLHRAKSTIDVHHLPNFDVCTILLPSPETAFGTKVQKCQTTVSRDFVTFSLRIFFLVQSLETAKLITPTVPPIARWSEVDFPRCKSRLLHFLGRTSALSYFGSFACPAILEVPGGSRSRLCVRRDNGAVRLCCGAAHDRGAQRAAAFAA